MKCSKCGYDIYEGTSCPLCGHENSRTANGSASSDSASVGGTSGYTSDYESRVSVESTYSMKWYKFLKVLLWFSIISNAISAIMYFTGSLYEGLEDAVYEALPSLKTLDTFCGVFCIALTVITFFAWHGLHNYKSRGPKTLIAMYILNVLFTLIYTIATFFIVATAETTTIYGNSYVSGGYMYQEYVDLSALALQPSNIISIISGIIFIIANQIYFRTRADLFIN